MMDAPTAANPRIPGDVRRFQRTALRQCTNMPELGDQPRAEEKTKEPESRHQHRPADEIPRSEYQGDTGEGKPAHPKNVHIGKSSMHYWIRRYAKPAIERARKPQVVNSSGEWELDIISLKYRTQQYYCWSVTDSRTQYILATERTSQLRIGEELFKMAIHAAGQRPHIILLSANMKKDTPGLAEQARTATLIQRKPVGRELQQLNDQT